MVAVSGAPVVLTNARVLKIAAPIVVSNATVPVLGLVDTGVVGQLGQAAPIGAVGIGAIVLTSVYWIFGFLRMGTTGLVAQSHGRGDSEQVGAHLLRALMIAAGAGLVMIVGQVLLFWLAFKIAPASPEVEALARHYLAIRIWGAPAAIAMYAITGWLIAVERTRGVLVLQLVVNGTNILLDVWFVLGMGWGVPGVAWATLIAEWGGLALGLGMARHTLQQALRLSRARLFASEQIQRLMRVNGDIMLRSVFLQASFTGFMFLGAGLGDVTLAANQVLIQFLNITAYALDGFAFAAETLVGQAVGARRPDLVRRSSSLTARWGLAGSVLLAAVFTVFGGQIIDILSTAPEVRQAARDYLPWLAVGPIVGIASWMFDGIFIGATLTREMRNAMALSAAIYLGALLILLPAFGNHGLWAALMVLNISRGLSMARYYPRAEAAAA